jgi:predicted acylesterase/phospholipase RssA
MLKSFLFAALVSTIVTGEKCRVLALQGGGDLGAYEVGAFWGLLEVNGAEESRYDVITGVSAGSINTLGIA